MNEQDAHFGKTAVAMGLIAQDRLELCLDKLQDPASRGQGMSLAEILVEEGYLSEAQVVLVRQQCKDPVPETGADTIIMGEPLAKDATFVDRVSDTFLDLMDDKDSDLSVTRVFGHASPLVEGEIVGRYKILEEIGRGGMGQVYKAYDAELDRVVALKLLLPGSSSDSIRRFMREARACGRLQHPNIVGVHDVGNHQGRHFFTMDFVAGNTLANFLRKTPLAVEEAVDILIKVGNAVHYAHQNGIVHRDLKPANIMIDLEGEPKVMDFGLAKLKQESAQLSQEGMILGTIQYMPVEQADGKVGEIDERSDVYSLGAIFYEALTGAPPFTGNSVSQIMFQITQTEPQPPGKLNPKVPRQLEHVCLKALEKNKERRYRSVAEMVEDLESFKEGKSVLAGRISLWRRLRRNRKRLYLAAVAIGVSMVAVFLYAFNSEKREPLHIFEPAQLKAQSTMTVPPSVSELEWSGEIQNARSVSGLFLCREEVPFSAESGFFKGKTALAYGANRIEVKIVYHRGGELCRTWEIVREKPVVQAMFRGNVTRNGLYFSPTPCRLQKLKWRYLTGGWVDTSPAVADGCVYFGSRDGYLYALDAQTGKQKWNFKADEAIFSSPAVEGGIVYFGSDDCRFYALDVHNGRQKWAFAAGHYVRSSPAVDKDTVYFGSGDKFFYALHAPTGEVEWKYDCGGSVSSDPAIADGTVYFGSEHVVYALGAERGDLRWKLDIWGMESAPAVADGMVYFGSRDFACYAADAKSGEIKWRFETKSSVTASPAVFQGMVYFASHDGHIYAFSGKTGEEIWKFKTQSSVFSSPAIAGDLLYFGGGGGDHQLYAIDVKTGALMYRYRTEAVTFSSPVIDEGTIYIGSCDCCLYAIE